MFPELRVLTLIESKKAVDLFDQRISKQWGIKTGVAKSWILSEFEHSRSVVLGAFVNNALIGSCALVPFDFVFSRLKKFERKKLAVKMMDQGM